MNLYKNRDWLYRKYVVGELTIRRIAEMCNVGQNAIWKQMVKFDIPRRATGTRSGKNHPQWKGGRKKANGYVHILISDHPYATRNYVLEHRLVMEKEIGRYLHPWEVVHHINGIRDDNCIENLELLSNRGKHNNRIQEVFKENERLKKVIMLLFLLNKEAGNEYL